MGIHVPESRGLRYPIVRITYPKKWLDCEDNIPNEVSLTTDEDNQDEDNIEEDGEPSTQQQEGHGAVMGQFRDGVTELMWTYLNQN